MKKPVLSLHQLKVTVILPLMLLTCQTTYGLDLTVGSDPNTLLKTPQIVNLGSLKRYHIKNVESAQALSVSCVIYANRICNGDPINTLCEGLPGSVRVAFHVVDATGNLLNTVSTNYNISWTGYIFDPNFEIHYTTIPATEVPLAGINLKAGNYQVKAVVDPFNAINESNEGNNEAVSDDTFFYRIYSGLLKYGGITTQLTSLNVSGLCVVFPGSPRIPVNTATANWPHAWGVSSFNVTPSCYHDALNADGYSVDLITPAGVTPAPVGTITGTTPSGLEAELRSVDLSSIGADFGGAAVYLPNTVTVHDLKTQPDPSGGINTRGGQKVDFFSASGTFTQIYDIAMFSLAMPKAYHGYGLPFFHVAEKSEFQLSDPDGLRLQNVACMHPHYPQYLRLNGNDPRSLFKQRRGFPSNDVLFMGFNAAFTTSALINIDGIDSNGCTFEESDVVLKTASTSFPRGVIHWNAAFSVDVKKNTIIPAQIPVDSFVMAAKRTCPDNNCGSSFLPRFYKVNTVGSSAWLTEDCAWGAPFEELGDLTEWGKWESANPTYRRNDGGKGGVVYLPGIIMPKTADESFRTVSQVLLGSRKFDGTGNTPKTLSPLQKDGTGDANRGNGFYAGLTLGPESLESLDPGSGQVLTADLDIRFNGNANYTTFEVTEYTKYFLRPSGVTGVFNTNFSGVINIYGYDLDFRRFAFRQVYNKLDGKTFLDGNLKIPYPADIQVYFLDLDLTCAGDLGSGEVDSEPESDWKHPDSLDNDGDTLIDEGNQVLSYWGVPILMTGMAFVPTANSGDACLDSEKRELQLNTLNNNNGLAKAITMSAIYPVNGKLKNQVLTAAPQNTYDKPTASSEPGFSIRLEKAYLNQLSNYPAQKVGFTNLAGLSDVPLFNDVETLIHLDNPEPDGLALPNDSFDIYVFKDESDSDSNFNGIPDAYGSNVTSYRNLLDNPDDAPESGDPRPRAKYSWPASGLIDLNYALAYNRSDGTKMPQFIGIQKVYNLVSDAKPIITLNTVPDYLNPKKTKFSFGVSADFAALASFQVNLNDLGDIDDFLHDYLGVSPSFSLEGMLSNVLNAENFVKEITGGDLTQLLAPVLDAALNTPPVNNVLNQFASGAGIINRIPQEIATATSNVLDELRAELLAEIAEGVAPLNGASGELKKLFDDYAAYLAAPFEDVNNITGNPFTPAQQQEIQDALDQIEAALFQVEAILNQTASGISSARNEVNNLTSQIDSTLTDVNNVLNQIKTAILDPAGALGNLTGLANNPIIQKVNEVKGTVKDVLNAINAVDIGAIASALQTAANAVGTNIDTSLINDINSTLSSISSSLLEIINQAENLLEGQYASMPTVFNDAEALLDQVAGSLTQVRNLVNSAKSSVLGFLDDAETQANAVKDRIASLRELLSSDLPVPNPAIYPDYNSYLALGQEKLNQLSSNLVELLLAEFPTGLLHDALADMQTSISGNPNRAFEFVFSEGILSLVDLPLKSAQEEILAELTNALEQAVAVVPAPSANDIKGIIRNAILNSDPVKDLSEAFYDLLSPVQDMVDDMATQLTANINNLIQEAIQAITEGINAAIESVTSAIADFDLVGARLDGYALVNQEELEQIHIEAEFTFGGDPDPTTYFAALDITSWNSENGKGACVDDGTGLLDAVISTRDISADMLGVDIGIKEAALGFTIDGGAPIGVFGRVYTSGELNFEAIIIKDIGLEFGMGLIENYLGATAAGRFESYTLPKVAFYFGKTCDFGVLERLDPEVATFVGEMVPLIGVYVRGSVEVPIYNVGCFFKVGVGADIGAWFFVGAYGGLVGGSAYGQIGCLASLKGKVTCMGQKKGDEFQFSGSGWAGAGIGFCSPEDWYSIADVRDDDWCVTGDASFGATYKNGWSIDGPNVNCCD